MDSAISGAESLGQFDATQPLEPRHLVTLAQDPRLDWIVLWDLEPGALRDLATAVGPRVAVFDAKSLGDR